MPTHWRRRQALLAGNCESAVGPRSPCARSHGSRCRQLGRVGSYVRAAWSADAARSSCAMMASASRLSSSSSAADPAGDSKQQRFTEWRASLWRLDAERTEGCCQRGRFCELASAVSVVRPGVSTCGVGRSVGSVASRWSYASAARAACWKSSGRGAVSSRGSRVMGWCRRTRQAWSACLSSGGDLGPP